MALSIRMDGNKGITSPGNRHSQGTVQDSVEVGRGRDGSLVRPVLVEPHISKKSPSDGKSINKRAVSTYNHQKRLLPRANSDALARESFTPASLAKPLSSKGKVQSWLDTLQPVSVHEITRASNSREQEIAARFKRVSEDLRQATGSALKTTGKPHGLRDMSASPQLTVSVARAMMYQIEAGQEATIDTINEDVENMAVWAEQLLKFNRLENLRRELDLLLGEVLSSESSSEEVDSAFGDDDTASDLSSTDSFSSTSQSSAASVSSDSRPNSPVDGPTLDTPLINFDDEESQALSTSSGQPGLPGIAASQQSLLDQLAGEGARLAEELTELRQVQDQQLAEREKDRARISQLQEALSNKALQEGGQAKEGIQKQLDNALEELAGKDSDIERAGQEQAVQLQKLADLERALELKEQDFKGQQESLQALKQKLAEKELLVQEESKRLGAEVDQLKAENKVLAERAGSSEEELAKEVAAKQTLRDELREAQEKSRAAESRLQEFELSQAELESKVDALSRESDKLKEYSQRLREEKTAADRSGRAHLTRYLYAQSHLDEAEKELVKLREQRSRDSDELTSQCQQLGKSLAQEAVAKAEVKQIQEKLSEQSKAEEKLKLKIEGLQRAFDQLTEDEAASQAGLEESRKQLEALQGKLQEAEQSRSRYESQLKAKTNALSGLEEEKEAQAGTIIRLEQSAVENQAAIASLEGQLSDLIRAKKEAEGKLFAQSEQNQKLEAGRKKLVARNWRMMARAQSTAVQMKRQENEGLKQLEALQQELESVRKQQRDRELSLQAKEKELSTSKAEFMAVKEDLENLRGEHENLLASSEANSTENEKLRSDLEKKEEVFLDLQAQHSAQLEEFERLKADNETTKAAAEEQKTLFGRQAAELQEAREQAADRKEQLGDIERKLEEAQVQLVQEQEAHEVDNTAHERVVEQLRDEVSLKTEEYEKASAESEELEDQLNKLVEQRKGLKKRLDKLERDEFNLKLSNQKSKVDLGIATESFESQKSFLESQLLGKRKQIELLEVEISSAQQASAGVQAELEAKLAELKELSNDVQIAEGRANVASSELDAERLKNQQLEEQRRKAEQNASENSRRVSQLEEENLKLRTEKIRVIEPLERRGSGSSGYGSDLSDDSEPGSPALFDKAIALVINLEEGVKQLESYSVQDLIPRQARVTLIAELLQAKSALHDELKKLDDQYGDDRQLELGHPPNLTQKRDEMARCYKECQAKIEQAKQTFESQTKGFNLTELTKTVDDLGSSASYWVSVIEGDQGAFEQAVREIAGSKFNSATVASLENKPAEELLQTAVLELQSATKTVPGSTGDEFRAYAAGVMVDKLHGVLLVKGKKELPLSASSTEPDVQLRTLEQYRQALYGVLPENLPMAMGEQIPEIGKKYLRLVVSDAVEKLELIIRPDGAENQELPDARGINGMALARSMIRDRKVCSSVLALLDSLQPESEGVKRTFNYADASLVGLRRIRDDHGYLMMPTVKELLDACDEDLERPDSALVVQAARDHYGNFAVKGVSARRKKLQQHVKAQQELEEKLKPEQQVRGQAHNSANHIAENKNQDVLDCFKPEEASQVLVLQEQQQTKEGMTSCSLSMNDSGLFNTFFDGAAGNAQLRRNEKTADEYLQLVSPKCQPQDLVFKKKRQGDWQVSLDHTTWSVNPAFLLNHPNFPVPFQGSKNGQLHRDWLPLKDANGGTALLVLRKTPTENRYFLYEMADKDTLVPRLIGPEFDHEERVEAQFMLDAASVTSDSPAADNQLVIPQVQLLEGANRHWLPHDCTPQLKNQYQECLVKAYQPAPVPLTCSVPTDISLKAQRIKLNTLREINRIKRTRLKDSNVALVTKVGTGKDGCFAHFSVDASFAAVGKTFLQERARQLGDEHALLAGMKEDQEEFRSGAFNDLTIYKGCELNPAVGVGQAGTVRVAGSPGEAQVNLNKVIKINRDHCMRCAQSLAALKASVIQELRSIPGASLAGFTDRQLLDKAVAEFEQGRVPGVADQQTYIKNLTDLMLVESDLTQSSLIGRRLQGLATRLERLRADSQVVLEEPEVSRYQARCQEWNLDMALLATQQKHVDDRLESYQKHALDSATLALLSFECRAKTVLRPNQVQEVSEALAAITESMEKGERMQRISHKGTGWGKSTVLLLLTDHAAALAGEREDCSVGVVAKEENQADLDNLLRQYYASKGRTYQRLNLKKMLSGVEREWWTPKRLDQIHNILLGVPAGTAIEDRKGMLKSGRAPFGASIKDIQILMNLRTRLRSEGGDAPVMKKLDDIMDLLRESMMFCDEWDSAMLPPHSAALDDMAREISIYLPGGEPITSKDIIRCHGEFVFGCRRKQLLSATTGTAYTAALASGATTPEQIKVKCNTDPFTTTQRARHWISSAQPVYFSSRQPGSKAAMVDNIIDRVGTGCQVMMFDGRDDGGRISTSALETFAELNKARESRQGRPKAMLFYDKEKHLRKYQPGDKAYEKPEGGEVPADEEALLRAEGSVSADVFLSQKESVGTDAPQGPGSVGVYMGLFEQPEAREDLVAQQVGRLKRTSGQPRKQQKLFIAVDMDQLPAGENSGRLRQAQLVMDQRFQALEDLLGQELAGCSPEQKALIHAPLQVASTPDQEGSDDEAMQAANIEIDRLKKGDWVRAKLEERACELLGEYKYAEYQAKLSLLNTVAVELAKKETGDYIKECEEMLGQARVNSYVDDAIATEKEWLSTAGEKVAEHFDLPEVVQKTFEVERSRQRVLDDLRNSAITCLKEVDRRVIKEGARASEIPELLKPDSTIDAIKKGMERVREGGIQMESLDALAAQLKEEGIAALNDARGRVNQILEILEPTSYYGKHHLEEVVATIDASINLIGSGTPETATNWQNELNKAYEMLFDKMLFVGVENRGKRNATKELEKVGEIIKGIFDPDEMTLTVEQSQLIKVLKREKEAVTDSAKGTAGKRNARAANKRGAAGKNADDIVLPDNIHPKSDGVELSSSFVRLSWNRPKPKPKAKAKSGSKLEAMKPPERKTQSEKGKSSIVKPEFQLQPDVPLNGQRLGELHEELYWKLEVKDFYSEAKQGLFQQCVKELEARMIEQYQEFSHQQRQKAEKASAEIQMQEQIMQKNMLKSETADE